MRRHAPALGILHNWVGEEGVRVKKLEKGAVNPKLKRDDSLSFGFVGHRGGIDHGPFDPAAG